MGDEILLELAKKLARERLKNKDSNEQIISNDNDALDDDDDTGEC